MLTTVNQKLLHLYKIPIDTNSNRCASICIQAVVEDRVNKQILDAKNKIWN